MPVLDRIPNHRYAKLTSTCSDQETAIGMHQYGLPHRRSWIVWASKETTSFEGRTRVDPRITRDSLAP